MVVKTRYCCTSLFCKRGAHTYKGERVSFVTAAVLGATRSTSKLLHNLGFYPLKGVIVMGYAEP